MQMAKSECAKVTAEIGFADDTHHFMIWIGNNEVTNLMRFQQQARMQEIQFGWRGDQWSGGDIKDRGGCG